MPQQTYLSRYQVALDANGSPLEIRRSANAVVYKAEEIVLRDEVALELLSVANLSPSLRQQLEKEAKTAKRLNHLNIPTVREVGFEGDEMVYVTEYFEGTTAEDWVKSHGPLPTGSMLRMALQAVSALGAAAFHGIFHYAINPRNIMLVPGQTPQGDWPLIKVLNFIGLAPAVTASGAAAMDPASPDKFASPEQLRDGHVDFRSEMYSLGCVLWFLLTGEAPQAGASTIETAGGMCGPVKRLLSEMLAIDPNERPLDPLALQQQIQECISHLERLQAVASKFGLAAPSSSTPIQASAVTRAPVVRKHSSNNRLALAALLLGLGTLAVMMLPDRERTHDDIATSGADSIGVPIGVPEASEARTLTANASAPVAKQTAPASLPVQTAPVIAEQRSEPLPPTPAVPRPAAPVVAENSRVLEASVPENLPAAEETNSAAAPSMVAAANPPVVTSVVTPPPAEKIENALEIAAAANAERSVQVADSASLTANRNVEPELPSLAGRPRQTGPMFAANSRIPADEPEPESPSEGPDEVAEAASSGAQFPAASVDDELTPTEGQNANIVAQSSEETDDGAAIPATTKTDSRATRPLVTASKGKAKETAKSKAAAQKIASRLAQKNRVASAGNRPPLPRGAIRAEFLGTTADGNLIFGLPSSERGYVAAPTSAREGASRRRLRRGLDPVTEQVPVLPALPPGE
ncbi:MAG: protein kinase [Chthoniobacterales bacterium]|nr:protein kinase [Chthoniobacterales bacterium]